MQTFGPTFQFFNLIDTREITDCRSEVAEIVFQKYLMCNRAPENQRKV